MGIIDIGSVAGRFHERSHNQWHGLVPSAEGRIETSCLPLSNALAQSINHLRRVSGHLEIPAAAMPAVSSC